MDNFDSLQEDVHGIIVSFDHYADAATRHSELLAAEIRRLWQDNAELRDELHALANRVETLTRARLTEPAEVAERFPPITIVRANLGDE